MPPSWWPPGFRYTAFHRCGAFVASCAKSMDRMAPSCSSMPVRRSSTRRRASGSPASTRGVLRPSYFLIFIRWKTPSPAASRRPWTGSLLFFCFLFLFSLFVWGRDMFQDDSQQTHNPRPWYMYREHHSQTVSIAVGPKSFSLYASRSLRSRSLALSRISLRSPTMIASLVEL